MSSITNATTIYIKYNYSTDILQALQAHAQGCIVYRFRLKNILQHNNASIPIIIIMINKYTQKNENHLGNINIDDIP